MAKEIGNPLEIVLQFDQEGDNWTVSGWTKYHMTTTEYPDIRGRDEMLDIELTDAMEEAILNFVSAFIYPQIAAVEGI